MNIYIAIIIILGISILILSISINKFIKNATYLNKKEREMVKFTIEMYVEYGEEIGITPDKEKHDIIINELKKINNKLK